MTEEVNFFNLFTGAQALAIRFLPIGRYMFYWLPKWRGFIKPTNARIATSDPSDALNVKFCNLGIVGVIWPRR